MRVRNLLIASTILLSACSQASFEQEPAPFTHSGGKYFHKNGTQEVASYESPYKNQRSTLQNPTHVKFIDGPEDITTSSSATVRSKPLAPVNSKYDETVKVSSNEYRATPVVDYSRSQQVASVNNTFVVKPKPVYDRPVRGGATEEVAVQKVEPTRAAPVVRNDSEYLDLSRVESFEDAGSSKLANIKPLKKPEYNKIETASGTSLKAEKIATPKPAEKIEVKEVAVIKTEVKEEAEVVEPLKIEPPKMPTSVSDARFIKPIDGQIIANFGDRSDGTFNDGINISGSEGTPVKAAADGSVVYSGNQLQGYGNLVIVRHDDGYLTAYAHLKDLEISKGAAVKQGDIIGKVGKSGNVESPQLHFGVRKGREPVDPKDFL